MSANSSNSHSEDERISQDTAVEGAMERSMVSTKIFETLNAPMLKEWTREAVRQFMSEREMYVAQMLQKEGGKERIMPLRFSLGDKIRGTFCDMILEKDFMDVTDDDTMDAMEAFLKVKIPGDPFPRFKEAVEKGLKMDFTKEPDARVFKFFGDLQEIIRKGGFESLQEKHLKKIIKEAVEQIKPWNLKNAIKICLEEEEEEGTYKTLPAFYKLVKAQTMAFAPFNPGKRVIDEISVKPKKVDKGKEKEKQKLKNEKTMASSKKKDEKKKIECYNCKGNHFKRDCPKLKEPTKQHKGKKAKVSKESQVVETENSKVNKPTFSTSQCLKGFIGMSIPVVFCLDTGATVSLLSKSLMDQVGKFTNVKFQKTRSKECIKQVDERQTIILLGKCRIDIKIDTQLGELNCRDVEFQVVDLYLPEVILGNSFLQKIGIDICQEVAKVSEQKQEWKCFRINKLEDSSEEETSKKGFEPPRAGEIPTDHPDFGDDMEDPIGDILGGNDPEELREALQSLVKDASTQGATLYFQEEMKKLLSEFEAEWRLLLGSDPPVKVTPMKVFLKPGMEPYKTTTRRYAPIVQDFMKEETE